MPFVTRTDEDADRVRLDSVDRGSDTDAGGRASWADLDDGAHSELEVSPPSSMPGSQQDSPRWTMGSMPSSQEQSPRWTMGSATSSPHQWNSPTQWAASSLNGSQTGSPRWPAPLQHSPASPGGGGNGGNGPAGNGNGGGNGSFSRMAEALSRGQTRFPPNDIAADFVFFLRNNHALLCLFLAHPAHPYSRVRRGLGLLNTVAFALFVTAVLALLLPPRPPPDAAAAPSPTSWLARLVGDHGDAEGSWGLAAPPAADDGEGGSWWSRHYLRSRWFTISLSALLQLAWDIPTSMPALSATSHSAPPAATAGGGGGAAAAGPARRCWELSFLVFRHCHATLGIVFALLGGGLLVLLPPASVEHVPFDLGVSKVLAYALAVPASAAAFLLARERELQHSAAAASSARTRLGPTIAYSCRSPRASYVVNVSPHAALSSPRADMGGMDLL